MPAIRDITWNATTVATGTTLVIARPAVEVNDLMLAIITADTGTATWTSSGWTLLFSQTNTAQQTMMWKIAAAGDISTASYTFTASTSESFNGCIVTIQDVNTTSPFGSPVVRDTSNQIAAAKYAMATITTNVANSLIIYAATNSGAGVPSLLEGPVYGLLGADGLAESMGVGWGFQPTAGLTSTVTCSNIATGAGVRTTLQIAPPTTGAVIVPTYCAADSSLYINPINGTTTYNGDTALAITADTNYGTTLGGFTAADGTVSAVTDVGINSFHSVGRLTSITGSQNLAGAELVLATANRPNVAGKNVLVHLGPSTEGQLQRFSTVSSGRGIWFGMRSAVGNNKIWQVYGAEKGSNRHVPVVINSSATNTKHSAGTLDTTAIQSFGFWVSGTGVTTTAWDFASLWVLDTTTIVGGNIDYPVSVQGITSAAATGKERKSVILQGSSQLLVLQPLQFGNAGTNPTYLELDTTAIEFPRQYNAATLDVTYNSVNNVAGITYNAGSLDTIKHTNSVISSANDFHWRIHASSSASATYDFTGLSLIGAGDVVLRPVTTFSGMSFNQCTTIQHNAALVDNCEFVNSNIISTTTDTANISNSSFVAGGLALAAMKVTGIGTTTLTGHSYTGFGTTNTNISNWEFFMPGTFRDGAPLYYAKVSNGTIQSGTQFTRDVANAEYYTEAIKVTNVASTVSGSSYINLLGTNQAFTFSFRIKFAAAPAGNIIILGSTGSTSDMDILFSPGGSTLNVNIGGVNGNINVGFTANVWQTISITRAASSNVLYVHKNGTYLGNIASTVNGTAAVGQILNVVTAGDVIYIQDYLYVLGEALYTTANYTATKRNPGWVLGFEDTTGSVTVNVVSGDTPSYYTKGATVTIVAAANVTLTGLVAGSEVRAYLGTDPATATAIDGIEISGTEFTFSQSVSGQAGYIIIFNTGYLPIRLPITYSGSDVSIPVQQITDRNYQP